MSQGSSPPQQLARQQEEVERQRELSASPSGSYLMWEDITSPFSAKVRAYLHYKGIPYRRLRATYQDYRETIPNLVGMPILPVMLTPDGRVMHDSTSIMRWLERAHPEPTMVPLDPRVELLACVLEDFADEYVPRFSMHFRWGTESNRDALCHRIARRMIYGDPSAELARMAALWRDRQTAFDRPLDLTDATRPDVEAQLHELLAFLEQHLPAYGFLLGDRPSMADFALYGHLFTPFTTDPHPVRLLETRAPHTCNWVESMTELGDARGGVGRTDFGAFMSWSQAQEALGPLFKLVGETWLAVGLATARASVAREKECRLTLRGIETTLSVHHFRAWAFEQVQLLWAQLSEAHAHDVRAWLDAIGGWQPFWEAPVLHNGLFDGFSPPFAVDGVADNRTRHLKEKQRQGSHR